MGALFVTSMGEAVGKSALCAGIGVKLQANGKQVGFFKPVSTRPEGRDGDAELMKQLLALKEPVEELCPVSAKIEDLAATISENEPVWLKQIADVYARVSREKDIVLIEGPGGFQAGSDRARISSRIMEKLGARALLIVPYEVEADVDQIVAAAKMLADGLLGIVINGVPERRMETVKTQLVPSLELNGIKTVGILHEDRALLSVSVRDLAKHIGGSILNAQDRSGELVENIMVGAMSVDSALSYLTLKSNKAVITRGDRPDIQLAALETSTKCLILTGNMDPAPGILSRAMELEVPIVLVEKDTVSTLQALEDVLERGNTFSEKKLEKLGRVLDQSLDFEAIYQAA